MGGTMVEKIARAVVVLVVLVATLGFVGVIGWFFFFVLSWGER